MTLFNDYSWTTEHKTRLDLDGHIVLPGLLTSEAQNRLTDSLSKIHGLSRTTGPGPKPTSMYAAEYDDYLGSLIADPQMLELASNILGENVRYDHCVSLIRPGGNAGSGWHTHGYGDNQPELGFIRIFFYVNGFTPDDGGLKAVPGSHLYRRVGIRSSVEDEEMWSTWGQDRKHPETGAEMQVKNLTALPGTVAVMWTHALHGVTPRQEGSDIRWCVVYAYRNPGLPSGARRISFAFEEKCRKSLGSLADLY
jgi:hypothetical protein